MPFDASKACQLLQDAVAMLDEAEEHAAAAYVSMAIDLLMEKHPPRNGKGAAPQGGPDHH